MCFVFVFVCLVGCPTSPSKIFLIVHPLLGYLFSTKLKYLFFLIKTKELVEIALKDWLPSQEKFDQFVAETSVKEKR